jgi:NAD(P)H-flavin reductase
VSVSTRASDDARDASVVLAARTDAGGRASLVRFGGSAEAIARVLGSYRVPGQYVSVDGSFFVLASAVGAAAPEILVRSGAGDEVADRLTTAPPGTPVTMSAAQGAGFPCERAAGSPLWIAVAGTGVAAARAVAAYRRASGGQDVRTTRIFVGVRCLVDLSLRPELEELERAGMTVTVCLSREDPPADTPQTRFRRGYVQDAMPAAPDAAPAGARLFVAGPDAMIVALRSVAARLGVDERDVHTNY